MFRNVLTVSVLFCVICTVKAQPPLEVPPAMKPVVVEPEATMKIKRTGGGFSIKVTVGDQTYEENHKGINLEIEVSHREAAKAWAELEQDRKDSKQALVDAANRVAKESGKMVREPKIVVVPAPAAPATSSCCGGGCATTGQPLCSCSAHLARCRANRWDPLVYGCTCSDMSMCGRSCSSCRRTPATSCSTSCRRFAPCAAPAVLPCALPSYCSTGVEWYYSAHYRYYLYRWNNQYYWYYRNAWVAYPYAIP